MHWLINLLDKFLFAIVLIAALQIPILADHYRQYLSGYVDATQTTVNEYQALADQFGYASVSQMIEQLQQNPAPLVRQDAQNKAATVTRLSELQAGLKVLNTGHFFEQTWYMLAPERFETLKKVGSNFSPSIPLQPVAVVYSVVLALLINALFYTPAWCVRGARRLRRRRPAVDNNHSPGEAG